MQCGYSEEEKLKLEYGSAIINPNMAGRTVNFSSDVGLDDKSVKVGHLHQIMNARLAELFHLIRSELMKEELLKRIHGGVLLTGGGAHTPQIDVLGQQIFKTDVIIGRDLSENGPNNILGQPEYTAAIGLVKYGVQQINQRKKTSRGLLGWLVGR